MRPFSAPDFIWQNLRYVFLDRDGVINRKPPEGQYVGRWEEGEILPGVAEAIYRLNRSGRKVLVVTNQRGVALGRYTEQDVVEFHLQLQKHLSRQQARLDGLYFCPHDKGQCDCRKPKTGMFRQAFREHPGALSANSVLIGDSLADIEAGFSLGMPTIFIQGEPDRQSPAAERAESLADRVAGSLLEAVVAWF